MIHLCKVMETVNGEAPDIDICAAFEENGVILSEETLLSILLAIH
jgi:hypothetical protein